MGTPRNAPCPCGSGKKYKKCCALADRRAQLERVEVEHHREALSWAIRESSHWLLTSRWRDELGDWIEEWLIPDEFERFTSRIESLGPDHRDLFLSLTIDYWLCERSVDVLTEEGDLARLRDVLLGRAQDTGSRPLRTNDARRQDWLESYLTTPLRAYRVLSVEAGTSITAIDLHSGEQHTVLEKTGSRSVEPGLCFAARIVTVDGRLKLFNHLWPLSEEGMQDAGIFELDEAETLNPDTDQIADLARCAWLRSYVPWLPTLADQTTGDPLLLTEFRYRVLDWEEVERRFSVEDDWRGSRVDDWVWLRDPDADSSSVRGSVYVDDADPEVVVAFARTARNATDLRIWFERAMGDAVDFLGMEESTPEEAVRERRHRSATEGPMTSPELAPEEVTELMQDLYRNQYRDFLGTPLPALGDRTPRDLLATAEGRRSVEELIDVYQESERELARIQNRPAASLGFLRELVDQTAADGD